jgi:hypothetical protein
LIWKPKGGKDNLIALHRFCRIFMHGFPKQVVISQYQNANHKGYYSEVFIGNININHPGIKMKEFTDHPVGVGANPEYDGQVMAYFADELAGAETDDNGNCQGRNYHGDAQQLPVHAPADVFKQPEHDVQVFHFTEAEGDAVGGLVRHYFINYE